VSLLLLMGYLTQYNTAKFVRKLFGEKDVDGVPERLDRLTQEEARTTASEALKVVYGLVQEMSERMHSTCHWLAVDYLSC